MTRSSRGVRVFKTCSVISFKLMLITASAGDTTPRSSMKSPRCESSSSPIGVSREMGSAPCRRSPTHAAERLAAAAPPRAKTACCPARLAGLVDSAFAALRGLGGGADECQPAPIAPCPPGGHAPQDPGPDSLLSFRSPAMTNRAYSLPSCAVVSARVATAPEGPRV